MALQKQSVPVNFSAGLDLKTDPYQVQLGNFLSLTNSVFTTGGRLTKRNGFANITNLPNDQQTTLTTLNNNLIATGSNLYAYSADNNTWLNRGTIQPVQLSVQPLIRVSTSQSSPDSAVAENGLVCLVYVDNSIAYYQISDSITGEQIVSRTALPSTASEPRVFTLGRYWIITFIFNTTHIQYIAIPFTLPASPGGNTDFATNLVAGAGYDGYVVNNNLYLAWATSSPSIQLGYLTSTLVESAPVTITGHTATLMTVTADLSMSTIWVSFWDSTSTNGYATAYNYNLGLVLAPVQIITTTSIAEMTSVATNGTANILYENINYYNSSGAYPTPNIRTDYISTIFITQAGIVTGPGVVLRSVGLASKAFIDPDNGTTYVLVAYGPPQSPTDSNQPSYFLIDNNGNIYMRLAYSNGAGYPASQVLPSVSVLNSQYSISYLVVDFLATVNKNTNVPANTNVNAIYTQVGVNLASFTINDNVQYSSEIAGSLQLTGGQVWQYDGVKPVELGFQVWPEDIASATATTGGFLTAQQYFYVFTYEWTDAQGDLHRSAPSIPYEIDLTGSGSSTNMNTLYVPTLRLTYKIAPNPVRIVGYRWSAAQQVYYQFTSITTPYVNNPAVDYLTITDTLADSSILGQTLLYTTGGVVEDIAPPACVDSTLYQSRLFIIDAEDRNLLWYSKQVIEDTPVEMSDLFTLYISPTTGAQGSTGPLTALAAMDDKLIMFKKDAIYYMTGVGPDNTGANSDFSGPIFITSSVGTSNPNSIVLMPSGLMFQSDKGIWLLGRDLGTTYIGAGVESYNSVTVQSAQTIPGTTQVRFILEGSVTLMYDYFYQQWGTFSDLSAISATLYNGLHTYMNSFGQVFQETAGSYVDGSNPVLMSYTTGWISAAGIRGYERFYYMLLLGTYYTPFKLNMQLAYDYGNVEQNIVVTPDNQTPDWGGDAQWGSGVDWGGPGNTFQARVFPQKQKCQTFQITMNEVYDASFGQPAGQGLTLSGMNMVIGIKKGYSIQKASRSFG